MSKVNYNHEAQSVYEACEQTPESLQALVNRANEIAAKIYKKDGNTSNVIEAHAKELSPDELSILLFTVQNQLAQAMGQGNIGEMPEEVEAVEVEG